MPHTRRRLLVATLVAIVIGILVSIWGRPFQNDQFYAFLEQHAAARQAVRPFFVLAGEGSEFDRQIQIASLHRLLLELDEAVRPRTHVLINVHDP